MDLRRRSRTGRGQRRAADGDGKDAVISIIRPQLLQSAPLMPADSIRPASAAPEAAEDVDEPGVALDLDAGQTGGIGVDADGLNRQTEGRLLGDQQRQHQNDRRDIHWEGEPEDIAAADVIVGVGGDRDDLGRRRSAARYRGLRSAGSWSQRWAAP